MREKPGQYIDSASPFCRNCTRDDCPTNGDGCKAWEKYFIDNHRNLQAEILAELGILTSDHSSAVAHPGIGRIEARNELIRDRIRLLYVGITRAKSSLTISFNTGNPGARNKLTPAVALQALWQE